MSKGTSGHQPAALPSFKIGDLMAFQDGHLGHYIVTGEAHHRREAESEALHDLWALCNALSAVEDTSRVTTTTWARLGGLAETLVARVVELRGHAEEAEDD